MHIPFEVFCQNQNKYCLAYLGTNLDTIKEIIKLTQRKDLDVYVALRKPVISLIEKTPKVIEWETINKLDFAHIELKNEEYILEMLNNNNK